MVPKNNAKAHFLSVLKNMPRTTRRKNYFYTCRENKVEGFFTSFCYFCKNSNFSNWLRNLLLQIFEFFLTKNMHKKYKVLIFQFNKHFPKI